MKKWKLLPGLAVKGVIKNSTVYYPYIIACIFSVFTYFIFSSILLNDIVATLPHSTYAWMMLMLGKFLLVFILIPFVYYANSFLIKRRKKETGLYTLLGMERKHLTALLFLETLFVYVLSVLGGIILGSVLAKLFFLLLLRLSALPVEAEFTFTWRAVLETVLFFAVVSLFTFLHGAAGIFRMRPVELLSGSKKGEKEPRFQIPGALFGVLVTLLAYKTVFDTKLDATIFDSFFLSVLLAVVGTYLLFTFAGVAVLKIVRRQKRFYYRPENFITISGMYYRMKKSAAGLANICIFSTMVVITLTCTVTLYAGLEGIRLFSYPYEALLTYDSSGLSREEAQAKLTELSGKYGLTVSRLDTYADQWLECGQDGDRIFGIQQGKESCTLYFVTLDDYNCLTGGNESLEERQILLYATGRKYGYDRMEFFGEEFTVKETEETMMPWPYVGREYFGESYVLAVKDEQALEAMLELPGTVPGQNAVPSERLEKSGILLTGSEEDKAAFMKELKGWQQDFTEGFLTVTDGLEGWQIIHSMDGGLLFIGILFGLVFFMCLLLVMYYKQLSEGYEDQGSFSIMQKVGMSKQDIQRTVRRQMLMVFALPLLAALIHSAVGMCMVHQLMGMIQMFDTILLIKCSAGVALGFAGVYVVCYGLTSKAYYRLIS